MERILHVAISAVITSIGCLVLRQRSGELALLLSLGCVSLILASVFPVMSPVFEVYQSLKTMSGISDEIMDSVFKIVGIGMLAQITSAICEDAGEKTLCKVVEISGGLLSMYAGLPLLVSVMEILEDTLLE